MNQFRDKSAKKFRISNFSVCFKATRNLAPILQPIAISCVIYTSLMLCYEVLPFQIYLKDSSLSLKRAVEGK